MSASLCLLLALLPVLLAAPVPDVTCESAGQVHKPGDVWVQRNHFKLRCDDSGLVTILGCYTPDGVDIPLGQTKIIDGQRNICEIKSDSNPIFYEFRIEPNVAAVESSNLVVPQPTPTQT